MKTGQLAKRLKVAPSTVRYWAGEYADYLSERATGRSKGSVRRFNDDDALVLATVADLRDKGLTPEQIHRALANGQRVDNVPELPTEEEQQARDSVALVPVSELNRALDLVRNLENQINKLEEDRDTLRISRDAANERIGELQRELGEARGKLQALETERQPATYWLRLLALVVLVLVIVAAAVVVLVLVVR